MTMRIENVIDSIVYAAESWVRLEEVRRIPKGIDLLLAVHQGRRGRRIETWRITCLGVHVAQVTARDLGGIALYSSTHPAARECFAQQAEVRWRGVSDETSLLGTLYKAHTEAVDDWIPFDTYSRIRTLSEDKFACRGPDFLMRAYAKALRRISKQPQVILRRGSRKIVRPRVLHFGESHIVANTFIAERG
jgi:hypothetical protein